MSASDFLARLKGVKGGRGKWTALCPAHEDERASLSVKEGSDGEPLVTCHAGCDFRDVFRAAGYERPLRGASRSPAVARTEVAVYEYTDAEGTSLYEVVRYAPKDFRQRRRRPDGGYSWGLDGVARVPYRLPRVLTAAESGGTVCVVEGEKDVLALESFGIVATTNAGGAGKWEDQWASYFAGASVVVLPDNDPPGHRHGEQVARSMAQAGVEVRIVHLPELPLKGDVSDWIAAGGTAECLMQLVEATTPYRVASPARAVGPRYYTLVELLSRPELLAPPHPVVPPFLYRGRVTLLAGREKAGKTTLVAHAAAALSAGTPFLGDFAVSGRVVWYALDEGLGDTVRRFSSLRANPDGVEICPDRPSAEQLAEKLAQSKVDLVVFDTMNELIPGTDLNRGELAAPLLRPYVDVLRAANVAGCILCHASKSRNEYLGDVRIGGVVDAVLTLKEPTEDRQADPKAGSTPTNEEAEDGPRLLVGKTRWGGKLHLRLTSTDGLHYEQGEAPLALDVRVLRVLLDADLSANDLQLRVRANRSRVQGTVADLHHRGEVEKVKQRYRITLAGVERLNGGTKAVPAPTGPVVLGTTPRTTASGQLSVLEMEGTSPSVTGTSGEPPTTKWFQPAHRGVSAPEPPADAEDIGDAGLIEDVA